MSKAAIYHFTDGGSKRPIVYEKELNRVREYAASIGCDEVSVYLDKTLKKSEQHQLDKMLQEISQYDALVMKDFYHLRRNTGAFMNDLIALGKVGVDIYSIEDGSFPLDTAPFNEPLRVAVYYCGLEIIDRSLELQFEIMDYFIQTQTRWVLVDKYADMEGNKKDGSQKEMQRLIANRDKYDLIMVQSFNDIHWRTAKFCKIRHQLKKDIYSMHDDLYLKYESEVSL